MSDLPIALNLSVANPHLPLSWYFDPEIYALEQKLLFEDGPMYVGHELMVPHPGDYQVLETTGQASMLVRSDQGVSMVSNICRHRQAVMYEGRGHARQLVCPLHRWTYDLQGKLLGAPHFPHQPCLHLPQQDKLQNWKGLLFAGKRDVARDLANLGVDKDLDFSGYVLDRVMVEHYAFNWKTFIEVYLEDYHVEPFHPGLGNFVSCDDLKWAYGEWSSVQSVGVARGLSRSGSAVYRKWQESLLQYRGGVVPERGAIWLTYYPNIMVEWYPHVLVVSTIIPTGVESCRNVVEFYYPEEIALFEREFVEAEQAAYAETAVEDDEICRRMHQGRKLLYHLGREEHGPYQSPMEDGMVHFHEFMRHQLMLG
jgi:phenylpropionate dioxygenase-like ring-hydroxylating dioxygenase large terminal subunit